MFDEPQEDVNSVLKRLSKFCEGVRRIWGNGNMFDNAIIRSLQKDMTGKMQKEQSTRSQDVLHSKKSTEFPSTSTTSENCGYKLTARYGKLIQPSSHEYLKYLYQGPSKEPGPKSNSKRTGPPPRMLYATTGNIIPNTEQI